MSPCLVPRCTPNIAPEGGERNDRESRTAYFFLSPPVSTPWKTRFHSVENRRIRLPCRGTFPGVPENDDSPCRERERRPAAACTSFPNPAASKEPSTSSSASTPPPANAPAQACPPWGRRRPACGTAPGVLTAIDCNRQNSKRAAARESRRFPLFHAWCMGGGLQFVGRWCNFPARDV